MRVVLQRVSRASVEVEGDTIASIGHGFLALVGVGHGDAEPDAVRSAEKVAALRVFADDAGKMNRSVLDVAGEVIVVSQFTLYADVRKGRRPSFIAAARPEQAYSLYQHFCALLRAEGLEVEQGVFQAAMQVALVNDGPVTIWIDTAGWVRCISSAARETLPRRATACSALSCRNVACRIDILRQISRY